MGRRKKTNFDESAILNDSTYGQYLARLTELATSMFEWKNLPPSIDERFLEMVLFTDGKAVFFYDEDLGYLCLKVLINGRLNVYNIPINRVATATNGYRKNLSITDSVIIYNNYLRSNTYKDIQLYAKRLYNLDRVIDVNANAQKTPILIQCEEGQRLSLTNLYKEYDGNSPVIFGGKNLDIKGFTVLKTDAPYVADKIYTLKTQIWNEALTYLGISNTNVTKKERMISDEVVRNQGGIIASRHSRLQARRQAVEEINRMFGLNIEVNYREDYREIDDEFMISGETGDVEITPMVADIRTRNKRE